MEEVEELVEVGELEEVENVVDEVSVLVEVLEKKELGSLSLISLWSQFWQDLYEKSVQRTVPVIGRCVETTESVPVGSRSLGRSYCYS